MEEQYAGVGILTFHCSDNFGAMLQAYGLKQFLCRSGVRASLVPYAPPYMIGRHWRIPYVPCRKPGGPLTCAAYAASGLQKNFCAYREFSIRRANMRRFRREYLVNDGQPAIHFPSGLRDLPYRCYVVGSDQIWNPEITFGLRPEYFGSFADKKKARVIAYAASLGGATLPSQYDRDFARLLQNLDAISLREQEAAGYVKRFYDGEVAAVLDGGGKAPRQNRLYPDRQYGEKPGYDHLCADAVPKYGPAGGAAVYAGRFFRSGRIFGVYP